MKTSIFPMLEPTYIIYPHTVEFSVTPTGPTVESALDVYTARVAKIDKMLADKKAALAKATKERNDADAAAKAAKADVWNAQQKTDKSRATFATLNDQQETRKKELAGAQLALQAMQQGNPQYAATQASVAIIQATIDGAAQALTEAKTRNDVDIASFKTVNAAATKADTRLTAASKNVQTAETAVINAGDATRRNKAALGPPPQATHASIQEEKGGLLFSAALNTEPSLPAAYSGFQGPVQYIQTNDAGTARQSIAYRVDTATRERDLDTMDYKEYTLLTAPPMGSQEICVITLKPPTTKSGEIRMSDTMETFIGSPDAVQTHVPNVHISVGAINYSIRSPVPDVVEDWKNAIFSDDEAGYLNAMKFTPRILQDSRVFGSHWKTELATHLSMISRSNCFKDSRLLLHAECQDAQKFVSKVLEYYMNNSDAIIQLQQKGQDTLGETLQKQLNAQIALRKTGNATGENIFSPDSFVKAFFLPKGTTSKAAPEKFITSVSPIMVDKILKKFTVAYDDSVKVTLDVKQNIEKNVDDTFTITPLAQAGTYTWSFQKEHGLNEIITQTRRHMPSFKCTNPYDGALGTVTEINVIYRGTLSPNDKELVENKLRSQFTQTESILNTYSWKLNTPLQISQQGIADILSTINNSNKRIFALTPNNNPDAKVTELLANLDITTNRITKTFLGSMGAGSPGKKIQYIDLSMAFDTGLSHDDSYLEIEKEYKRMATLINARQGEPDYDEHFLFKDKYVFQA
jgi:hypothetical protein